MMAKTSTKKVKEGTVFFDDEKKSGVFIQAQFKRCHNLSDEHRARTFG